MTDPFINLLASKGNPYPSSQIVSWSHYNDPIVTGNGWITGNSRIWGDASQATQDAVINALVQAAAANNLSVNDTALLLAIIKNESGFNPSAAAGPTSASGMGQFINATGAEYGLTAANRWDINAQAQAAVDYYIDCYNEAAHNGQDSSHIYAYWHDGLGSGGNGDGINISNTNVMPNVNSFQSVLSQGNYGLQSTNANHSNPAPLTNNTDGSVTVTTTANGITNSDTFYSNGSSCLNITGASGLISGTATNGTETATFNYGTGNTVRNISVDSSGNLLVNLNPASGTGLSQTINLSSAGASIISGGSPTLVAPAGSTVTQSSTGVLSLASAPVQGWGQTTTLNANGTTSQTFSATDANGNPISINALFATYAPPIINQATVAGSNFTTGGSQTFQNYLNSTLSTQANNLFSTLQLQTQTALTSVQNNFTNGTLSGSLQYLQPTYAIFSQANSAQNIAMQDVLNATGVSPFAGLNIVGYSPYSGIYTPVNPTVVIYSEPKIPQGQVTVYEAIRVPLTNTGQNGGSYGNPKTGFDPLVLSLNGQGINLTPLSQSQVRFDTAGNGISQPTGWIGANTGFLVLPNGSNPISGSNLLTFSTLAALDSNHDGIVNASDSAFSNLRVWADSNNDGVAQSGELSTLSQLGINSISTASTATTQNVGGNVITATGTVTFSNGTTEAIDDVTFASLPPTGTLPLQGQSATALTFMQKVLGGLAAKAQGIAAADSTALVSALTSLAQPDALLAGDEATPKSPFGGGLQMFDATRINMTTPTMNQELFQRNDASGKNQLWITNGTTVTQLTSITSGTGANPTYFTTVGSTGKQIFQAQGANGKAQLWVTDGTVAGTQQLTSIGVNNGLQISFLQANSFLAVGTTNREIFAGNGTNGLQQLWVTDGTTAGTQQLTNISVTVNGSAQGLQPTNFVALQNGSEMFTGYAANGTYQLWITDGTSAGTYQLTSNVFGTSGLNPYGLTVLGITGKELFGGNSTNSTNQLWITDGTAAGTQQLTTLGGSSGLNPSNFITLGTTNKELFKANNVAGSNTTSQLWATDGTTAGTVQLTNVSGTSGLNPTSFISLGTTKELFQGIGTNGKNQLWGTDGTVAGTQQLTSIGAATGLSPTGFIALGSSGRELFQGIGTNGNNQIWSTDGTTAGTIQLTSAAAFSANVNPTNFVAFGNTGKEFFKGYDANGVQQLWITDGTAVGTIKLTNSGILTGANIYGAITVGSTIKELFSANDASGKSEMWATDGTLAGTQQLTTNGGANFITVATNGKALINAYDASGKYQIFVTDGTAAGTTKLTSVTGGVLYYGSSGVLGTTGKTLINGSLSTGAFQLWVTDGTVAGTQQITNYAGAQGLVVNGLSKMTAMGNTGKVLFNADINNGAEQIWVSDGTSAGTMALTSITGSGVDILGITAVGTTGKYLVQGLLASGTQTWITDGTVAGTQVWAGGNFIVPTVAIDAPALVRQAEAVVAQAIQSTNIAAQSVQFATTDQTQSDIAAVTANTEDALVGTTDEINARQTALNTETQWQATFASMASASTALQSAVTTLANSQTVVNSLVPANGSLFVTTQDAQEAADTASEQATAAQALATAEAAFQSLITATAQAWNANQATVILTGQTFTAAGGDLIVAAAGTETLSDGSSTSTYAILQGANVQISNFHAGPGGSRLDFLNGATTAVFTQVSNGTQITVGTSVVTLVGVNISSLSLYDNFAGVQIATVNGAGLSANMNPAGSFIDDGTTHFTALNFGTGGGQTLTGASGYEIYNFASGDGTVVIQNGVSTNNGATGELDFGSGINGNSLLFTKSGNDLVISVFGTSDQVTVKNWFTNGYSQLSQIKAGDGTVFTNTNSGATLVVNNTNGTSQIITPSTGFYMIVNNYSGLSGTGTLINQDYDFNSGGSQVKTLNPNSSTSVRYDNWTAFNGTGTETSVVFDWATGGSERELFNPDPSTTYKFETYTGADLSGTNIYDLFDWSAGGSQYKWFNPNASEAYLFQNWSQADGHGTHTSDLIDWTNGTSQQLIYSGLPTGITQEAVNWSGSDTTGSITSTVLYGDSNGETLAATTTNETLIGGGGYDTYQFGSGNGQDTIQNGLSTNSGPTGELDLGAGITTTKVWFEHIGNNLQVDLLGSSDHITIANWYGSNNNVSQLQEIKSTASSKMIDTQLANLVQAMATYGTNNPGFNPVTATQMPTDTNLQSALAAAWH